MSYTATVRELMCETDIKKVCCAKSELFVIKYFFGSCDIVFCDSKALARRVSFLCKKIEGMRPDVLLRREKNGRFKYFVKLSELLYKDDAFFCFEKSEDCCKRAFLRACFIAGGAISDPERSSSYIELYHKTAENAELVKNILTDYGIKCGIVKRREKYVVYIKNFDGICDFLILTGAQKAMLDFQVKKAEREVSNNVNRALNCDMANIDRTSESGTKEALFIQQLKDSGRLDALPEHLSQLAKLRLENPLLSLSELGNMLNPPLSKSGVSHRMKKILES